MAITLASFHTLGKHPSRKHLLKRVVQNVGSILCILFTIAPSIPSGPGHFLSCSFLIISSISWSFNFGTAWEAGGFETAICALMIFCCALSCAVWSSGKNLWRRAMGFTPSLLKKRMTERCSSLVHVASRAATFTILLRCRVVFLHLTNACRPLFKP